MVISVLRLEQADERVRQQVQGEGAADRDQRHALEEIEGAGRGGVAGGADRRADRRGASTATAERLKTPITSRIRSFHRIALIRASRLILGPRGVSGGHTRPELPKL